MNPRRLDKLKNPPEPGQFDKPDDAGHVMVLLIGYVLVVLLLITVVAAAGSVYIGHKKLFSMADGAALAAADTFELSGGSGDSVPGTLLSDDGVLAAAQNYLGSVEAQAGLDGIVLDPSTGAGDGRSAQVSMSAVVHPLFINFLVPDGITISVTSTARARLLL